MIIKIKKLSEGAHMPQRATTGAAGLDLCALCDEEGIVLKPMQRKVIYTGLAMELPSNEWAAFVFARSGMALNKGLALANSVGVVDSDYRGELRVPMINLSNEDVRIENGQRVAQMVIMPVAFAQVVQAEELSETVRAGGGLGSTGV